MRHEPDAADLLSVALVAAMIDRFDASVGAQRRAHIARIADMIRDAQPDDLGPDECIAALGLLAARAVEDVAMLSGEPISVWLERWLDEPYGTPPDEDDPAYPRTG
jgi:hypothetical protein